MKGLAHASGLQHSPCCWNDHRSAIDRVADLLDRERSLRRAPFDGARREDQFPIVRHLEAGVYGGARNAVYHDRPRHSALAAARAAVSRRGRGTLLLAITFPTDHLSTEAPVPTKPAVWWKPLVSPGGSKVVEMILTNEPIREAAVQLASTGADVIAVHSLPCGQTFAVRAADSDWAGDDLIAPAGFHEVDDIVFPRSDDRAGARPVRLTMFSNPSDGDALLCQELSGFKVPASMAKKLFPDANSLTRDAVFDRGNNAR